MKVIDLINMINNEEDLPEKMIINKRNFHSNVFKTMIYEEDCNTDIWMAIKLQHIDLDDTVTVIEDNTIDIDRIRLFETEGCEDTAQRDLREYINTEIVPYLKQLNKEIKELKKIEN